MKKLITAILTLAMLASLSISAFASEYNFSSGGSDFGNATSTDEPVSPDPSSENVRRNKDAAYTAPKYGIFSGEIPTNPTSPYHNNGTGGSFTVSSTGTGGNAPTSGDSNYGSGGGSIGGAELPDSILPSTSVTETLNTMPWFYEDGSIGTLYISSVNKTIKVYEGESLENMKKGIGHFESTSAWDGNVSFAGHNRGAAAYFSFVKNLSIGDRITYTTRYGSRTYEIYRKEQINEWDNSPLSWTSDNILTLITCVENVPDKRWAVQAKMIY